VIAIVAVNLRRAVGDRRLLALATLFPVLFILVTGLLAGSPKEPIGLVHPSPRLLALVARTDDVRVHVEPSRAALSDDILRGRVVAGLIELPAPPGRVRAEFVTQNATADAVQARTDVVGLLNLVVAEGSRTGLTDATLARARIPPPLSPFSYVAPADLVLFGGITILVLSAGLVETRRLGLLHRMAAAPLRARTVVAAEVGGLLCIAAAQSVGLLAIGWLLFGVHWGNPLAIVLILGTLSLAYAGTSVLIGTLARSPEQALAFSVIVGIAAGMLGGCIYSLDVVGTTVRAVGHVTPQAWAMDAFVKLIYHHGTLRSVAPEVGALVVFAVALCALAVRVRFSAVLRPS
jgi:ABC-2 type transport system permease protein